MLEWASGGSGVRLALIVHHTDAEREWAYDRKSSVGKLDKALDAAQAEGWTVVDMKNDWKHDLRVGKSKSCSANARTGERENQLRGDARIGTMEESN